MTAEEAKENQERIIAEGFSLGFWYGTKCEKCCGVYPKLITHLDGFDDNCRYECEVCGKKTAHYKMPWIAEEAWNNREFVITQGILF